MKSIISTIFVCAIVLSITSCKKELMTDLKSTAITNANSSLYTVATIAGGGSIFEEDLDGIGKKASFASPWGITVAKNGDVYVADVNGNSIRKIAKDSIVTTIAFPDSPYGGRIPYAPTELVVSNDGTITFAQIGDFRSSPGVISYKPGSPASLISRGSPNDVGFSGLSLDPHYNLVWMSVDLTLLSTYQIYRVDPPLKKTIPSILQVDFTGLDVRFTGIAACENDVKFLVANGKTFYKLTDNSILAPTLSTLKFNNVTSIAATRDAKTIYLVADKSILKVNVDAATFETIVGPDGTNTNKDGVGKSADVNAFKLALSPDEKSIYFVNDNALIRKLNLQ